MVRLEEQRHRLEAAASVAMELDINPEGSISQFIDNPQMLYNLIREYCLVPDWQGNIEYDKDTARPKQLRQGHGAAFAVVHSPTGRSTPPPGIYKIGCDLSAGGGNLELGAVDCAGHDGGEGRRVRVAVHLSRSDGLYRRGGAGWLHTPDFTMGTGHCKSSGRIAALGSPFREKVSRNRSAESNLYHWVGDKNERLNRKKPLLEMGFNVTPLDARSGSSWKSTGGLYRSGSF